MKFLFVAFGVFASLFAKSQYYFTDIIAHQQSEKQYQALIAQQVKKVKATSYDGNGEVSEGINIVQTIKDNGNKIITKTSLPNKTANLLENEYEKGRLVKSVSSDIQLQTTISTITRYTYNQAGLLIGITTASTDTSVASSFLGELHIWEYNEARKPIKMLKIINSKDTLEVVFTTDEKGNIAEEKWMKKGVVTENFYYYYDNANQITDVVRYNSILKKLMPDFIYEYSNGIVTKMTQTIKGGRDYYIWKYAYNEKGLKESETCFNKQRQFLGKMGYGYE